MKRIAPMLVALIAPSLWAAAVKPGLEGGQELFRRNHWEEARAHLRAQWNAIPEKDRPAATFLIGRSYAREAEFFHGLRRFGDEVGLAYLAELHAAKATRAAWLPLFTGLYEVDVDRDAAAERTLLPGPRTLALPPEWKTAARLRRAVALRRLGRASEAAAALKDTSAEGRFCALLASGVAEPPAASSATSRDRLFAAAVLFRAGRGEEAEKLLAGINLDTPDVEDKSDPKKILRFHDPLLGVAWERIGWERAVLALKPLAASGAGNEKALATYYVGLGLFRLGALADAAPFLKASAESAPGPDLQAAARVLLAATTWPGHAPAAADLSSLWDATQGQAEAVLQWDELRAGGLAKREPFASKLDARLRDLLAATDRPAGALVGRWGLARLRGADTSGVLAALSEYRDKSNKNKLEWNDPLLLLALCVADYRETEYAQSLETLFELSKTFPGLRPVQWNLQGIYAARQKAGGETRISQ